MIYCKIPLNLSVFQLEKLCRINFFFEQMPLICTWHPFSTGLLEGW
ncbi:hypothetical protein B23_0578 [Geobacillus thermoleovorans B23]|nr:hypothetical protein B23_0578 [Geobacillus thermoleovorans B23]